MMGWRGGGSAGFESWLCPENGVDLERLSSFLISTMGGWLQPGEGLENEEQENGGDCPGPQNQAPTPPHDPRFLSEHS